MHYHAFRKLLPRLVSGPTAVAIAVGVAMIAGMAGVVPVGAQGLSVQAEQATGAVPLDDPWAPLWDEVGAQDVPLSAQNVVAPFGGTVQAVTARVLYDDDLLYVLLEWADDEPNEVVNGVEAFSDAAALQFPGVEGTAPPYTMGGAEAPVNIWQWKAVWQADIERGFSTSRDRYPNTYSDLYPSADDDLNYPARDVGNPLAQLERESPIENLVAVGFGTLTTANVQDVMGSGAWRDGLWRALFARSLAPATDGLAAFAVGTNTAVAVAVWDGGAGDRNGQKAITQFMTLDLGGESAAADEVAGGEPFPPDYSRGVSWQVVVALVAVALMVVFSVVSWVRSRRTGDSEQ